MSRLMILFMATIVFAATQTQARTPVEKAVIADTAEKFQLLVEAIRQEMAPGKRYEFLRDRDRETVNQALDRMAAMLAKSGTVDALNPEEKTRLFNDQEVVNGLLAKNADDRLVCTYVAPVGSHLPVKTCRTAREIAQSQAKFRRQADELGNRGRVGSGPGN